MYMLVKFIVITFYGDLLRWKQREYEISKQRVTQPASNKEVIILGWIHKFDEHTYGKTLHNFEENIIRYINSLLLVLNW